MAAASPEHKNHTMTVSSRPSLLATIFSGRMLVAFLMGFAAGLPLVLTGSLLKVWLQDEGVDLGTIGLFALVGLPYTLKFLWAPLLDRYVPSRLGRRRGWLLLFQLALVACIAGLGLSDPREHLYVMAVIALLVSFFSASQDIVIDAYRRESLSDEEQGLGSSLYVNGYRLGLLLASGGGLILADFIPFSAVYALMAGCMLLGVATTLFAREPELAEGAPKTLLDAVIKPFVDYFSRTDARWILLFILLYKLGDTMAGEMASNFYRDIGFSKTEIGSVVKLFGFWATIVGSLVGGVLILRLGIFASLVSFGVLQAVSTLGFAWLAYVGHDLVTLGGVVTFENFTAGMGTAAYIAFMASLTNKKFTATQYALLSSLMGVPRTIFAAPTGYIAAALGWQWFFVLCTLIALPGLLLLAKFRGWLRPAAPDVADKPLPAAS